MSVDENVKLVGLDIADYGKVYPISGKVDKLLDIYVGAEWEAGELRVSVAKRQRNILYGIRCGSNVKLDNVVGIVGKVYAVGRRVGVLHVLEAHSVLELARV